MMFLGYQKDKIVFVASTREELANNKFIFFDRIEKSEEDYALYEGEYLTLSEISKRKEAKDKQEHISDLKKQLSQLDDKSNRSMRAILTNTATEDDRTFLSNLETQAAELRRQIRELEEI